jgi:hypothetical protein
VVTGVSASGCSYPVVPSIHEPEVSSLHRRPVPPFSCTNGGNPWHRTYARGHRRPTITKGSLSRVTRASVTLCHDRTLYQHKRKPPGPPWRLPGLPSDPGVPCACPSRLEETRAIGESGPTNPPEPTLPALTAPPTPAFTCALYMCNVCVTTRVWSCLNPGSHAHDGVLLTRANAPTSRDSPDHGG